MTTTEIAQSIILGTYRPWDSVSYVATREQWLFYAQCALDGDDVDLDICLGMIDDAQGAYVLPDDESWMHGLALG